jgi:hypothetical protein
VSAKHPSDIASKETVLRGMKSREERLRLDFDRLHRQFVRRSEKNRLVVQELAEKLRKLGINLEQIRGDLGEERKEKPGNPPIKTTALLYKPFIFSTGQTITKPYDYDWTWEATYGRPDIRTHANKAGFSGWWSVYCDQNNPSAGYTTAGIGVYFAPPSQNGSLNVSTAVDIKAHWGTWCNKAYATTWGKIELIVDVFNVSNNEYVGEAVNLVGNIFFDYSYWFGIGDQYSSNSAYPISANLPVDNSHWYVIWILTSGEVEAEGTGIFTGSYAEAYITMDVPYITWSYSG